MERAYRIINEIKKAFIGKDDIIKKVVMCTLAKGHILLEDIPGVGKTTLALAISKTLMLQYNRIQFTPDVLPSDVTGYTMFNRQSGEMEYQPGAVLCNLLLADEINRATSRTQAALLEAMEEEQVTVDSITHILPQPFIVIATQNPVGSQGTQLLPDSQMDRFMIRLSIGYPAPGDEIEILKCGGGMESVVHIQSVADAAMFMQMQQDVGQIFVNNAIYDYIIRLIQATRHHPLIRQGASTRASLAVMRLARACAFLDGRDYVIPQDVKTVFKDAVSHRLILSVNAKMSQKDAEMILDDLLQQVKMPGVGRSAL